MLQVAAAFEFSGRSAGSCASGSAVDHFRGAAAATAVAGRFERRWPAVGSSPLDARAGRMNEWKYFLVAARSLSCWNTLKAKENTGTTRPFSCVNLIFFSEFYENEFSESDSSWLWSWCCHRSPLTSPCLCSRFYSQRVSLLIYYPIWNKQNTIGSLVITMFLNRWKCRMNGRHVTDLRTVKDEKHSWTAI